MPGSVDINPSADCEKDVTVSKEPKSIATTTVEIQDDFDLILNLEVNDKGVYICKGRLQGFYPIYLLQDSVLRSKKLGNQPYPLPQNQDHCPEIKLKNIFHLRLKAQTMRVQFITKPTRKVNSKHISYYCLVA